MLTFLGIYKQNLIHTNNKKNLYQKYKKLNINRLID
jgi:hypothetical protein